MQGGGLVGLGYAKRLAGLEALAGQARGEQLGQVRAADARQLVELGAAGEAVGEDGRSSPALRTAGSSAVSATATETS